MTRLLTYLAVIVLFAGSAFGDGILTIQNDGDGGPLLSRSILLLANDGTYQTLATYAEQSGTAQSSVGPIGPDGSGTYALAGTDLSLVTSEGATTALSMTAVTPYHLVRVTGEGPMDYELYLREPDAGAGNVSNLNSVAAGGSTTTGFVIVGPNPRWVLIRAVGPSLSQFGVSPVVAAPSLTVYTSRGGLAGSSWNYGYQGVASIGAWSSQPNLTAGIGAISSLVGAFPLTSGSSDCAVFGQLAPGAYTVVCSAPAGQAGSLMTEVYVLPY